MKRVHARLDLSSSESLVTCSICFHAAAAAAAKTQLTLLLCSLSPFPITRFLISTTTPAMLF